MKLNKPHVFLYKKGPAPTDLELIVLVPSHYKIATPRSCIATGTECWIDLTDYDSSQIHYHKKVIHVDGSSERDFKVFTKTEDGQCGFTILNTYEASKPWPASNNYFVGFHLEVDNLVTPQCYNIHGLVSDYKGQFDIILNGIVNGEMKYNADLYTGNSNGNYESRQETFSNTLSNGSKKVKITINGHSAIDDGQVILHHADSDPKNLPSSQACV